MKLPAIYGSFIHNTGQKDPFPVITCHLPLSWKRMQLGQRMPMGPLPMIADIDERNRPPENGGEKVVHGSGGMTLLRQACIDMTTAPELHVSINASAIQLRDPRFPEHVLEITSAYDIAPDHLTLELTESALIEVPHLAKERMEVEASLRT